MDDDEVEAMRAAATGTKEALAMLTACRNGDADVAELIWMESDYKSEIIMAMLSMWNDALEKLARLSMGLVDADALIAAIALMNSQAEAEL